MRTLVKAATVGALLAAVLGAAPAFAATPSELRITADGKFSAKNVVVLQKSGTTLFCRGTWGNAFVRLTVLSVPDTIPALIVRNHGGTTTIDEVQEGDLVSIEGSLVPAADSLQINAKKIVDFNLNKEPKTFSGIIQSVDITAGTFVLPTKTFGNVTVVAGTSTIQKGARTIVAAELKKGDKVLSVTGTYDYTAKTLVASSITIYQDKSVFLSRTFSGTVRSIAGATLPTTIILDTANASYTVYVPGSAQVLSSHAATDLSRFAAGDKVRIFGTIRPANLAEIDATILRDLNF